MDTRDEERQLELLNKAFKRGASILTRCTSQVVSFEAQVGGMSAHKKTFLSIKPFYVLKPLRLDHRKAREIGFYEMVHYPPSISASLADSPSQESFNLIDQLRSISHFIPRYYGVAKLNKEHVKEFSVNVEDGTEYIILEDLTRTYSHPCVIDIKMGTQSFEPDASAEKKHKEMEKYLQQADFGLRIVAMRVYDPLDTKADRDGYLYYSKHYGRSLSSKSKLKDSFRCFFGTQRGSISSVLRQLEEIEAWFLKNDSLSFYSSSIMIVYEGNSKHEEAVPPTVKMIDFARVRRKKGTDEGYLIGLTTLITLLREIEMEPSPTTS